MSMKDEIFKGLTGQSPGPDSFGAMLHAAREAYPSRRAMSRGTGIPETTLRRWDTHGINQKAQQDNMPRLVSAYRASLVNKATAERWKADGMVINVAGVPGKGGGNRPLSARNLKLESGTGEKVVAKFLAGDDKGAALALRNGIGDPWYRNVMFGSWIDDDDLRGEENDSDGYAVSVSGVA